MRSLLTWLMVLGVFAGLSVRALAASGVHHGICEEKSSECCESDAVVTPAGEHDQNNGGCPPDHHHHEHPCCTPGVPHGVDEDLESLLKRPASKFLGYRHEGEVPPDGPFLSSEKPPLI